MGCEVKQVLEGAQDWGQETWALGLRGYLIIYGSGKLYKIQLYKICDKIQTACFR